MGFLQSKTEQLTNDAANSNSCYNFDEHLNDIASTHILEFSKR